MTEQATHQVCQVAVDQFSDTITHHLVPRNRRDGRVMVCRYCGRTQAEIEDRS